MSDFIRRRLWQGGGLRPEQLAWIFGSERTGSTWLARMMAEMEGHAVWDEPLIGLLFGDLYYRRAATHSSKRPEQFIFGDSYRGSWLQSIKAFVMSEARARFPKVSHLTIKEPNGSLGAPLVMEAMPESALVLLVRDPRDAVASSLKSHQQGGWLYEWTDETRRRAWGADRDPDTFVRGRANYYTGNISAAAHAYEAHRGRKLILRYEDLLADTLVWMHDLYSALEVVVDEGELAKVVQRHSWENIPASEKGQGKFNRKATPGGWREDLTPEQAKVVREVTAPLLQRFYPET